MVKTFEDIKGRGRDDLEKIVRDIKSQDLAEQKEFLSAPLVVAYLVGFGYTNVVMDMIDAQPKEARKDILLADLAVSQLVEYGKKSAEIIALIKEQPLDAQKEILSKKQVLSSLVHKQQEALFALLVAQPPKERKDILLSHDELEYLLCECPIATIKVIKDLPAAEQKELFAKDRLEYVFGVVDQSEAYREIQASWSSPPRGNPANTRRQQLGLF